MVVDFALLRIESSQILIQRRAFNRRLFPGMWELPGGHLECGETIEGCICRELSEECGMTLKQILGPLHHFHWPDGTANWIYAILAEGEPVPERDKVLCQRWITQAEVGLLGNGLAQPNDPMVGARLAFELMGSLPRTPD